MAHLFNFLNGHGDSKTEIAKVVWGALTLLEYELQGKREELNDLGKKREPLIIRKTESKSKVKMINF